MSFQLELLMTQFMLLWLKVLTKGSYQNHNQILLTGLASEIDNTGTVKQQLV